MPIMDGFEATKKIRTFNEEIVIIALSAAVTREDLEQSQDVGMNGHLAKPIDIEAIKQVLTQYLEIAPTKIVNIPQKVDIEPIEGVNMDELLERFNYDEKSIYRNLKIFTQDNESVLTQIKTLDIHSDEFDTLMHNLKGLSGNLALTDIYYYASRIYQSKDKDEMLTLLPLLEDTYSAVTSNIIQRIQIEENTVEKKDSSVMSCSKETLLQEINILIEDSQKRSFISQDRIDKLSAQLENIMDKKILSNLSNAFNQFDYKSIDELLMKIKGEL